MGIFLVRMLRICIHLSFDTTSSGLYIQTYNIMETPKSVSSVDKSIEKVPDCDVSPASLRVGSIKSVEEGEVFAVGEDGVDFRTVGWIRGTHH